MADKEHVALLKQGVNSWNEWRENNPEIRPDLSKANLSKANLSKANLSRAYLNDADLNDADLSDGNLTDAYLSDARLQDANLARASLSRAYLSEAYLMFANLSNADLTDAYLSDTILTKANFTDADLTGAELYNADLTGAELYGADLTDAKLNGADLRNADLRNADLSEADLRNANLSGADLRNADLRYANLRHANLSASQLIDAKLTGTQALAANFENAILTGACIEDWNTNNITTNFNEVICEYVYLQEGQQKRIPLDRDFTPGEFSKLFQSDRSYSKLSVLETLINRFEKLLDEYPQGHEKLFHNFLIENPVLLDVYGEPVSKPKFFYPPGESPLGKKYVEPDVIIRYPGNKYKLVELEKPSKRLGTKQGQPTSELNQAAFQITEWDDYIREYPHLIKNDYPGISSHRSGMVVIGRRTAESVGHGRDIKRYMQLIVNQYPCEVCFYDDLLDKAKQAYEALVALSL
jgi:uncharacterized protein YjbI with pentapeptide repeats